MWTAALSGLLVAATLTGNALVIVVVARRRRMRSVTNLLLASLATADLTVAALVMPLLALHDVLQRWPLGQTACRLWISCDVMCCTASILHLLLVALDRFFAITHPLRYRAVVTRRRVALVIFSIWACSAAISFIPIFMGWYRDVLQPEPPDECSLRVNRVYAVVSSLTSFYLPLPIMFYVYFRILVVAERQAREIKQLEQSLAGAAQRVRRSLRRRSRQLLTDTKAIRTLGIVMGVFCVCWLPFFLMYVIVAYCQECEPSYEVRSAITWLGYVNSAFNPCIYAFLNKEFKTAFMEALTCRLNERRDSEASTVSAGAARKARLQPCPPSSEPRTPSLTPDHSWPHGPFLKLNSPAALRSPSDFGGGDMPFAL